MRLVDLTQVFRPGMTAAVGRGGPEVSVAINPVCTIEANGTAAMEFVLGDHAGTHIDAPKHVVRGGRGIDEMALEEFYGPAVALDVRRGDNAAVTVADLEAAGCIEPGDMVFLETGWSAHEGTDRYREHHPYLEAAAAEWLVERRVRAVGIDASSLDLPRALRPPGFHHDTLHALLAGGVAVIHGLTNLAAVRGRRFTAAAFPIVFAGADAGPARVAAILDDGDARGGVRGRRKESGPQ